MTTWPLLNFNIQGQGQRKQVQGQNYMHAMYVCLDSNTFYWALHSVRWSILLIFWEKLTFVLYFTYSCFRCHCIFWSKTETSRICFDKKAAGSRGTEFTATISTLVSKGFLGNKVLSNQKQIYNSRCFYKISLNMSKESMNI